MTHKKMNIVDRILRHLFALRAPPMPGAFALEFGMTPEGMAKRQAKWAYQYADDALMAMDRR